MHPPFLSLVLPASFLMVAVADHPEGPFTSLGPREMGTPDGFASDMNVFKDGDGPLRPVVDP